MAQAVIFDFGDTLVDYPLRDMNGQLAYIIGFIEGVAASKIVSLESFGSASEFANRLNTENSDNSTWSFVERVRSDRFFGPSLSEASASEMERRICEGVFSDAKLLPDALPAVRDLKSRGIKTGIVSNLPWGTSSAIWKAEFSRHGFGPELMDDAVCCVDAGYRKPHPAAITACLKNLSCDPRHSLYVGDRPSDVMAGKAAGCRTILIKRREDSYTDKADVIIDDLNQLKDHLAF